MGFNDLLRMTIEREGSDLFLTCGAPPSVKAFGKLTPLVDRPLPPGAVKKIRWKSIFYSDFTHMSDSLADVIW